MTRTTANKLHRSRIQRGAHSAQIRARVFSRHKSCWSKHDIFPIAEQHCSFAKSPLTQHSGKHTLWRRQMHKKRLISKNKFSFLLILSCLLIGNPQRMTEKILWKVIGKNYKPTTRQEQTSTFLYNIDLYLRQIGPNCQYTSYQSYITVHHYWQWTFSLTQVGMRRGQNQDISTCNTVNAFTRIQIIYFPS